jgi:chemotaxis signal transduction protein
VQAWRGEIVAIVNLDDYLSDIDTPVTGGMLLVARHPECAIGLRVPGVGVTTTIELEQLIPAIDPSPLYSPARVAMVQGVYNGCPVLDIAALLADVALQIEMAAHHV